MKRAFPICSRTGVHFCPICKRTGVSYIYQKQMSALSQLKYTISSLDSHLTRGEGNFFLTYATRWDNYCPTSTTRKGQRFARYMITVFLYVPEEEDTVFPPNLGKEAAVLRLHCFPEYRHVLKYIKLENQHFRPVEAPSFEHRISLGKNRCIVM